MTKITFPQLLPSTAKEKTRWIWGKSYAGQTCFIAARKCLFKAAPPTNEGAGKPLGTSKFQGKLDGGIRRGWGGGVKRLGKDEARLGSVLLACAPVSVCMDDRT